MKGIARIAILVVLVLVLTAAMATTALAKPRSNKPGIGPQSVHTVYADDAGWVKTGTWVVEDYTGLEPGGTKILVANDAGASVTYTFGNDVKNQTIDVYCSTYWLCGSMDVSFEGKPAKAYSLTSSTTAFGVLIVSGKFSGNGPYTITLTATGTGGPTAYPAWHFVNVQYITTY
jgi:hypothetical protein